MTLVNFPNINNLDSASADLWNSRYAAITSVLNGNIDASNVKDNSITYGKLNLAANDIPIAKIGLTPTVTTNSGTAGGTVNYVQIGTFLMCWGTTASKTQAGGGSSDVSVVLPVAFATAPAVSFGPMYGFTSRQTVAVTFNTLTTTGFNMYIYNFDSISGSAVVYWTAVGKSA